MEASIGTIFILAVLLFIIYRTGLMRLTQTASERAIAVTDSATQVWELASLESHSRKLGKINKKLSDDTVERSSATVIKHKLAKLHEIEEKEDENSNNS